MWLSIGRTSRPREYPSTHFAVCTTTYIGIFFQPMFYSDIFPSWAPWQISAVVTGPMLFSSAYGVWFAAWTDKARGHRARTLLRARVTVISPVIGSAFNILAGCGLLYEGLGMEHSTRARHVAISAIALACMTVGGFAQSGLGGPFWALHHELQPTELRGVSIALVNSIGNLGGFVGPYVLAAFKTSLGPPCPPHHPPPPPNGTSAELHASAALSKHHDCVSSFAWGFLCVSVGALCIFLGVTCRLSGAARRLLDAQGRPAVE